VTLASESVLDTDEALRKSRHARPQARCGQTTGLPGSTRIANAPEGTGYSGHTNDWLHDEGDDPMSSRLNACLAAALLCAAATVTAAPAPQAIENFARRPQMYSVKISPDGRYIAFLSGAEDDTVLMTFDRTQPGSSFKRVAASQPNKFDIGWCNWANNKRLLCGVYGNVRGKKYAESPSTSMIAVNADGTGLESLQAPPDYANPLNAKTSMRNFNMNYGAAVEKSNISSYAFQGFGDGLGSAVAEKYFSLSDAERSEGIIDYTPDDPSTVLIQSDDDADGYRSIFELNIDTGKRAQRFSESPPIQNFITDGRGNPRIGWGTSDGLHTLYYARLEGDREWRKLVTTSSFSQNNRLRPIAVAPGANAAYAVGAHQGREALWVIDLADKGEPQLLFQHPLVDVGDTLLQSDRRIIGVRYDVERPYVWYADPKQREFIDRMESQFAGRAHEVIDTSEDKKIWLVQATSDVDAGTYFIYDVANDKLQRLGVSYPELDQKALGTMTYITYKATDGTEIPGYLTVPSGAEKKKLPLIVMPHDGPIARDSWKFSYLRTFLANRGFAVLQMNYRGSAGFGAKWRFDAHQDWGGLTYSDIHDATKWAIAEGIADPQRVCIMGTGFGGYAALLGAVRNADVYRCAISLGGIVDEDMQVDHGIVLGDKEMRRAQVGNDKEKLKRSSPLQQADKIRIPVLLVHGTKDWQVQMDHSKALEDSLSHAQSIHKAVYIKNAGHDFERKSERVTVLREVEAFLQKNMFGGRVLIDDPK
jgi:dipeptidyl aminopeptidase/acylaminoacyl peptidase